MAGLNKVTLIGNLGKDPEIRTIESGVKVASFSIATTESYRNKNGDKVDMTEWHNIVLWRGLADIAEQYLSKGRQVFIEGRIRTRSYDDKDGITRYRTEIIGDNMILLGSPAGGSQKQEDTSEPKVEDKAADDSTPSDDLPF